jgi:hypothetical protein
LLGLDVLDGNHRVLIPPLPSRQYLDSPPRNHKSVHPSRSLADSPLAFTAKDTETSINQNTGVSGQEHSFWAVKSDGSRSLGSTDDLDHQRLVKDLPS